ELLRAEHRAPAHAVAARRARDDRVARRDEALRERLLPLDLILHADVPDLGHRAGRLARVGLDTLHEHRGVVVIALAGVGGPCESGEEQQAAHLEANARRAADYFVSTR